MIARIRMQSPLTRDWDDFERTAKLSIEAPPDRVDVLVLDSKTSVSVVAGASLISCVLLIMVAYLAFPDASLNL